MSSALREPARRDGSPNRSRPIRGALAALAAAAVVAAPALSVPQAAAADRSFVVSGSLQDELGCGSDWQPDCAATALEPTGEANLYAAEFEVPEGSYEYKIAVDGGWDEAYGLDGGDENIPLTIAGPAQLRFVFDDETHRAAVEVRGLPEGLADGDEALVADPVRQAGSDETFYFVMTDRFANGDAGNDTAGIEGDRLAHGFDPADKGFYHGGDIAGLRERLDYIEGLGSSAIWLTPSFANQPVQGAGDDASAGYHGYWVTDFTRIDPHLGTNDELRALIDDAHARGIKVYFDIITNHTADVIDYAEGEYGYIDQQTAPYTDAAGGAFDPADYAGTDTFPELDAATSFPYTPVVRDAAAKTPDWLNDPTLYHNRGDSTWAGESVTYGDFVGLDDLMTEHPTVVNGFVDVYQDWVDLGIDGFRIDTVKHVNIEFWEQWTSEVADYAQAQGRDDFFMFGEVYDADPTKLSPYVRDTDMSSVLDFAFQSSAVGYAGGNSARVLSTLFAGDDRYTTPTTSASALPTFLGNHDMGRVGSFLQNAEHTLERDELAHELMFLTRGQPVVYYGDEQGFAGPGGDKDARHDMFTTEVAEYADQPLVTGENAGSLDRYDQDAPLYQHIAALSELRDAHPALDAGAQTELYAEDGAGVYAFSRVDRDEKVEYLVAVNNSDAEQSAEFRSLTADASYATLYGGGDALTSGSDGSVSVTVPALSAIVHRADAPVSNAQLELSIAAPTPGAALEGLAPVEADLGTMGWAETSFSWRVVGSEEWTPLGVAEDGTPRVFHDVRALPAGTLVEYRAVATAADGSLDAASTYASVGHAANLDEAPGGDGGGEIGTVTLPGSHNTEMGCVSDWDPACEAAALAQRADGIYEGAFDLPAGDYEYKAAIDGTWAVNYGANGEQDGPNLTYAHDGGSVTFYFDPRSHVTQSSLDGPIVTIPGSFQQALGCEGDWDPACLASIMHDGDRDGVYELTTDAIPGGSYEGKVAHGMSWDENYGVGGAPGGDNYAFSVADGEPVSFRYTLETHTLEIAADGPAVVGVGELRAHWIDETTLAWPAGFGADADGARWELVSSADATIVLEDGAVTGGETIGLSVVDGGLTDAQRTRFPTLADATALRIDAGDRDAAADLLRGQLAVAQHDADGALTAFTGVQLPGVIDDLYAEEAAGEELGAVFRGRKATFRLWAPTAQQVTLLTWGEGDADPRRLDAERDDDSGSWTVKRPKGVESGDEYLWEVRVYAPETGRIETNLVTDPYSAALTTNSQRSVAIDMHDKDLRPKQWRKAEAPDVERSVDRAIYELHIRDFSITDESVPEGARGTYLAFAADSDGTRQLRELADAGITSVHLLPSFDIATIEEDPAAQARTDCDLASMAPDSDEQQACIAAIAADDGFNWGYDPFHFFAPEGSYATEPEGGSRVAEFRAMVGALHEAGLEVILDQVYNHTAASGQAERSVLDRVVPGYYHRLDETGAVETSTCCENVATEHALAGKLMVDAVVWWAREYLVDGFRFDLMGHHSKENMLDVRAALDELTLDEDDVDGSGILLYGEGWNFGEVADGALFEQATQGQLGGTGIATFNDRLRDAVHGGSPVDSSSTRVQGFGTGLGTDPNGDPSNGTEEEALADLAHQTDLVRLGLVGNLRDYSFVASDGEVTRGEDLDYRGSPAGYADEPDEVINYVDAHDNETLYDLGVLKMPVGTSMDDRVRMNALAQATVTLSQGVPFWHAGTELLRSKSLDRNSYDSGDWFNRIDWTGQESTFGSGLPPKADNGEKWDLMAPLLADETLKPDADAMADAERAALDLLRIREEVPLLRLGRAELIAEKVSFPNSGPDQAPGVIAMHIDDLAGEPADPAHDGALVVFNASPEPVTITIDGLAGRDHRLSTAQQEGADAVVRETSYDAESGSVTIPARTVAVLVEDAAG
ncbi:pullulanase-type alpha-1,6-glucosidase [Microbacterium karelineae]|uniref:pullulanase-type alpha-1,6-glucosidase n=1 Tax=Microbacterium karelineae TaxID=2654283 RepID=UPI0012E9EEB6|nr:pullulanase-type alpha-1,6-glucosidase [Microbacterium karelineae]